MTEKHLGIQSTLSVESDSRIPQALSRFFLDSWQALSVEFKLSWSHYVVLLTLDNPDERSFYEIEAPSIGIVLCHRKNDALVELTLPEEANIYASKYQLYLPSKEELKQQIESITRELEGDADAGG